MMRILNQAPLPLYLAACLVLGGSTNGLWTNLALQLGAVALLATSLFSRSDERAPRQVRQVIWLMLAAVVLVFAQQIPLPPSVWSPLPGREFVTFGFVLIGQVPGWMPLSLEPAATLDSACFLLPPLAVLTWVVRGRSLPIRATVAVLLLGGFAGALIGFRQFTSHDVALLFYPHSNTGNAPGFFANSSHMALMMLAILPFLAAFVIDISEGDRSRAVTIGIVALTLAFLILTLVAFNKSATVLLLTAPVLFMTVALWGGRGVAWLRKLAVPLFLAAIASGALIIYLSGRSQAANETSYSTRSVIWSHTLEAIAQFKFVGSGFGTFAHVYRRFEPLETLDVTTYVNHAHNDYLELALEGGIPAVILIVLFLLWWSRSAWLAWRGTHENVYVRAATIASGGMLLHEIVEYPLRSPAIAAFFALCIGLMAVVSTLPAKRLKDDLWASRHLVIG